MSNEIKLLRPEDIDWIRENGDEALVFADGWLGTVGEAADGIVIGLFAGWLNKYLTPYIPDNTKLELHDVFDAIIDEETDTALQELADVADTIIEEVDLDERFKPWLNTLVEIYRGILINLSEDEK